MRYRLSAIVLAAIAVTSCGISGGDAAEEKRVEVEARSVGAEPTTTTVDKRSEMRRWASDHADSILGVSEALDAASTAASAGSLTGLFVACDDLLTEATAFGSVPPSPDEDLNDELDSAMSEFRRGAQACMDGVLNVSETDIDRAVDHLANATDHIRNATDIVESYT